MMSVTRSKAGGFTLLEVLVALFIVGIATGVIGLAVGAGANEREIRNQVTGFDQWLESIRRNAVVRKQTYTITLEGRQALLARQYSNSDKEWRDAHLERSRFFFADSVHAEMSANDSPAHDVENDRPGNLMRDNDDLDNKSDDENTARLMIFPDATYTPFRLHLLSGERRMMTIRGDGINPPVSSENTSA